MAYNGPIWYIDPNVGFDSEDNGSEGQPLESLSFAVSRIIQIGLNTDHIIKIKKSISPYAGADLRSLPTSNYKVMLTAWNPKIFGIPEINGIVYIKDNMSVEGFKFTRNAEAIFVDSQTVKNITIKSNVFTLIASAKCIIIGNITNSINNVKISLNTFVDKGTSLSTGVYFSWGENPIGVIESEIVNNIFYANNFAVDSSSDINIMPNKDLLISNNNIHNEVQTVRNSPEPINTIIDNPLFVDYILNNFELQENSPCKNAGLFYETAEFDIQENPRPVSKTYDLGAYEYQDSCFSQIIGGNGFFKDLGVSKISVIDHAKIINLASSDIHFDNDTKWERVIAVYKNITGQKKIVTHKKINEKWKGIVEFTQNAEAGVWEKIEILVVDKDGDVLAFNRATLGNKEDIYIS